MDSIVKHSVSDVQVHFVILKKTSEKERVPAIEFNLVMTPAKTEKIKVLSVLNEEIN